MKVKVVFTCIRGRYILHVDSNSYIHVDAEVMYPVYVDVEVQVNRNSTIGLISTRRITRTTTCNITSMSRSNRMRTSKYVRTIRSLSRSRIMLRRRSMRRRVSQSRSMRRRIRRSISMRRIGVGSRVRAYVGGAVEVGV